VSRNWEAGKKALPRRRGVQVTPHCDKRVVRWRVAAICQRGCNDPTVRISFRVCTPSFLEQSLFFSARHYANAVYACYDPMSLCVCPSTCHESFFGRPLVNRSPCAIGPLSVCLSSQNSKYRKLLKSLHIWLNYSRNNKVTLVLYTVPIEVMPKFKSI